MIGTIVIARRNFWAMPNEEAHRRPVTDGLITLHDNGNAALNSVIILTYSRSGLLPDGRGSVL